MGSGLSTAKEKPFRSVKPRFWLFKPDGSKTRWSGSAEQLGAFTAYFEPLRLRVQTPPRSRILFAAVLRSRYDGAMKIQQAGGHIDQLIRQTRAHHVQLSAMADVKANTLMTMSAVMMTLSVPYLANDAFRPAVVVLFGFGVLTIILAMCAVLPGISRRGQKAADPKAPAAGFNLLFFGDFVRLSLEEYKVEMEAVMNDPSRTYEVQVQEIYVLGKYLASRKYRLLRCAYLSFISGIAASGAALAYVMLGR